MEVTGAMGVATAEGGSSTEEEDMAGEHQLKSIKRYMKKIAD